MSTPPPIRVAVAGAGAFGRNHARVYHELQQQGEPVVFAGVLDTNGTRAQQVGEAFAVPAFSTLEALIREARPQAVSVAVPTAAHLPVARALMDAGIDVLIEKPLARSLEEADELIGLAETKRRIAQTGHLERFNPAVRATWPLLTRPMFFEVHRLSPFSPRALDVDVILDLMIHDLDIVLSFVDSPVKEIRAVGLPILSRRVDIANVRLEFESGCIANFTASRVSTERVRKMRFFQPYQYVSLDYTRQDVLVLTVDAAAILGAMANSSAPAAPETLNALIKPYKPRVEPEEPLRAELRSFLAAVRRRTPPLVSLQHGRRALVLALDIVSAISKHAQQAQLESIWSR